jgi:hypothetical protein
MLGYATIPIAEVKLETQISAVVVRVVGDLRMGLASVAPPPTAAVTSIPPMTDV